jgi:hypothetical protein
VRVLFPFLSQTPVTNSLIPTAVLPHDDASSVCRRHADPVDAHTNTQTAASCTLSAVKIASCHTTIHCLHAVASSNRSLSRFLTARLSKQSISMRVKCVSVPIGNAARCSVVTSPSSAFVLFARYSSGVSRKDGALSGTVTDIVRVFK